MSAEWTVFLLWCIGGAVFGGTLGVALADPERAWRGLRDAFASILRELVWLTSKPRRST